MKKTDFEIVLNNICNLKLKQEKNKIKKLIPYTKEEQKYFKIISVAKKMTLDDDIVKMSYIDNEIKNALSKVDNEILKIRLINASTYIKKLIKDKTFYLFINKFKNNIKNYQLDNDEFKEKIENDYILIKEFLFSNSLKENNRFSIYEYKELLKVFKEIILIKIQIKNNSKTKML